MPVWQHFLSEEEIWKVAMFIYDYTGRVPRVMKEAYNSGDTIRNAQGNNYGVSVAYAQEGHPSGVKAIYEKRCAWCHGWEGAGDGPAAEFLSPRPRDFTAGAYKYKSSPYDSMIPTDEDLLKTIRDGLPGTSMPGWGDLLSEKEIGELVTLVKGFSGVEEKVTARVKIGKQSSSSEDSIKKGRELFSNRCSECHGEAGHGDANKVTRTDWGERVWPRDLTKPWTYRWGSAAEDIYTRVSTGIPGTPMPSFADPENKKGLTEEERWHVVNFVKSIQKETPAEGESVVRVIRAEGEISEDPMNSQWEKWEASTFHLVPQIIAKERHFTPTITDISVSALYNDKELAFLLEWGDRTKSIPGDVKAQELSEGNLYPDAVAIQWPVEVPEGMEKPYFGHGDGGHPVNIWYWNSGTTSVPEGIRLLDATGLGKSAPRDGAVEIKGKGVYKDGLWRVVMKRPLKSGSGEGDIQFEAGKFIPMAFAAWDGSNGESGSKHVLTTWYWAYLKPPSGGGVFATPIIVMALVFGGEMLLARQVRKKYGTHKKSTLKEVHRI
jgi:DMSO reductase family type II enzyme heme b subunit